MPVRTFPASLMALALLAGCSTGEPASGASTTGPADPAPLLTAHTWLLTDATDAAGSRIDALFPRADQPLALAFADGRVQVSGGCNSASGNYRLSGATLEIDQMMQTQMACAAPLMDADAAITSRLTGTTTLEVEAGDPPRLQLATGSGDVLGFSGQATAETRYGGPGTQMFLEVAPEPVACSHPLMPDHRCLRVREIHYDTSGVKTSTGEWSLLYQEIEGYRHEPGIRNVLRLKRFEVADPPADASSVAYVLDMVVESELVSP